ncbi:hypothetical protein ACIPWY_39665 [Streptomyces sp. NPDC090032]|uniref:hypothetical protein n=1 Tax=unclassified Streptomyces TaxID=2593676 RepID=UPI003715D9EA
MVGAAGDEPQLAPHGSEFDIGIWRVKTAGAVRLAVGALGGMLMVLDAGRVG